MFRIYATLLKKNTYLYKIGLSTWQNNDNYKKPVAIIKNVDGWLLQVRDPQKFYKARYNE